jgi:hypothetical protein
MGGLMEPHMLAVASERLGLPVHECRYFLQHPDLAVFGVDLDGYFDGPEGPIPAECKCRWELHSKAEDVDALEAALLDDNAPWPSHTMAEGNWAQLQAALEVTGAPFGYLVYCIGGWAAAKLAKGQPVDDREVRVLKGPRFEPLCVEFVPRIRAFWADHVLTKVCPADVAPEDAEVLRSAWRVARAGSVVEVSGLADVCRQLREAQAAEASVKEELKPLADEVSRLKAVLVATLQEHETGRDGDWTVSARTVAKAEYLCKPKPYRDVRVGHANDRKGK